MKMPDRCPICNGIMLIVYINNKKREAYSKACTQINHNIYYLSYDDTEEIAHIGVYIADKILALWFPNQTDNTKTFSVVNDGNWLYLPYFEPDFSNYKKLVEKIKTYLVFS